MAESETSRKERARYYIAKAIEAEESAAKVKSASAREQLLRVAKGWRELADEVERSR